MLSLSSAQIAVVFSKVARFDFPRAWPNLLSDLLAKLQVGAGKGGWVQSAARAHLLLRGLHSRCRRPRVLITRCSRDCSPSCSGAARCLHPSPHTGVPTEPPSVCRAPASWRSVASTWCCTTS